jgi:hypothetical protein
MGHLLNQVHPPFGGWLRTDTFPFFQAHGNEKINRSTVGIDCGTEDMIVVFDLLAVHQPRIHHNLRSLFMPATVILCFLPL